MRILIYTHTFAPNIGGVETVVKSLASGFARWQGADGTPGVIVTVATRTRRGACDDKILPFQVVRLPSMRKLLCLIWAADIVHLFGPALLPMLMALLFRKPLVVEHCGFQAICPNGQLFFEPTQKPCPGHFMAGRHGECIRCNANIGRLNSIKLWILSFLRRWLCARAQSNIVLTNWLGELLHLPRSTTVYPGLPDNGYCELSRCASLCSTFAFVGRLVSTKGVQTLLQAVQQLRAEGLRLRLKVIGDGPDREPLRQQASALGVAESIEFLGYLSPERLEEHLAAAATVVMPSLAGETFGMVAAENMSRGKLLVVSDVGAMREVIGDTGMSFAPGDIEGLACCLRRVLKEPDLAHACGKMARQRALKLFREERRVGEHLAVYRRILKGSNPSPNGQGSVPRPLRSPKP